MGHRHQRASVRRDARVHREELLLQLKAAGGTPLGVARRGAELEVLIATLRTWLDDWLDDWLDQRIIENLLLLRVQPIVLVALFGAPLQPPLRGIQFGRDS